MLVGGNIKGDDRVLTTAIVLAGGCSSTTMAMALPEVILPALAFLTNLVFHRLQVRQGGP